MKTLAITGRELPASYQRRLGAEFNASAVYEIHPIASAARREPHIVHEGVEMPYHFARINPDEVSHGE